MTISDDRLTSPKFLAFMEKLLSHHYWSADDYDSIPGELMVEIYNQVPVGMKLFFEDPFPFVLDMKQINS